MRRTTIAVLCAIAAWSLLYAGEANVLKNADFAATVGNDASRAADWQMPANNAGAWARTNEDGPTGGFCLRYQAMAAVVIGPVTQPCTCKANADYELSFSAKSDGTLRPVVRVVEAESRKVLVRLVSSDSKVWKAQSKGFKTGAATKLLVEIYADAAHEHGKAAAAGTASVGALRLGPPAQAAAAKRPPAGDNIALGKPYTYTQGTYRYCTDPGDRTQLTDGVYTKGYFWTQKTTVGWSGGRPGYVSIDLGKDEPIKGVSFSSAAGVAQVEWPQFLLVFVSPDGKQWYEVGDLAQLSARKATPPKGKYATHIFWTDELATHGRYVQIAALPGGPYLFVDEIEVYRGDDALLLTRYERPPAANVKALMSARQSTSLIQAQLRRDLAAAREDIDQAPATGRAALAKRADELAKATDQMPIIRDEHFKAILPMTDLEREIFRLQAAVWRAQGKPPLRVWKTHRWDPLAPSQEPAKDGPAPVLDVRMMNNEHRADVLNITNADSQDKQIRLRVHDLPAGADPAYIAVHEVLHVGTRHSVAVAAALPEAKREGQDYVFTVPAGMTRQVWLSFNPKELKPGKYQGRATLDAGGGKVVAVPIRLQIYPLRFPDTTSLLLGGWSYTDVERQYGCTPKNRDALIALLQDHHVNAPWATSSALGRGKYDAEGTMVEKPDTARFDAWVKRWPNAKRYMVFVAIGDYGRVTASFGGSQVGTAAFKRKVGNWIRFWAQHMRDLGLKAGQLGLLLVDEPNRKEQFDVTSALTRAIHKAEPDVLVWVDVIPLDFETPLEMMTTVNVLVPNRAQWLGKTEKFHNMFHDQRKGGRELGFYSCSGPARRFDPFGYYLVQQWHVFAIGGRWAGFWAFADNGRVSCWNEYPATGNGPYCPVYLDDTSTVTTAKYMEAIRESVQDYEYLVMLRDRIAALDKAGNASRALAKAKALLSTACDRVLNGMDVESFRWDVPKNRSIADTIRIEVLDALTALKGK